MFTLADSCLPTGPENGTTEAGLGTEMHISFDSQSEKDLTDPHFSAQVRLAKLKGSLVVKEERLWSQTELSSDPVSTI